MLHTTAGAERILGSLLTVEIRFMHVLERSLMLVALMTLSATAAGCAYALSPPRIVEGRAFDRDKLAALTTGMQPDQVEKVLGPPIQRNRRAPELCLDLRDGPSAEGRHRVAIRRYPDPPSGEGAVHRSPGVWADRVGASELRRALVQRCNVSHAPRPVAVTVSSWRRNQGSTSKRRSSAI